MGRLAQGHSRRAGGFTLIELCLVIALIGTIMAIALPRFLPAISYSMLEGTALHLGHYGRAAMAQAVLSRELLTVRIDLDKQEYKAVHRVEEFVEDTDADKKQAGKLFEDTKTETTAGAEDLAMKAEEMQATFDNFARLALQSRAKNVQQDDGILRDIGPLFEKEFKLDPKEEEKQYQDVTTPLLMATVIPDGARIESVRYGGKDYVKGVVKIEITPLGLGESVLFHLLGENGAYYTVLWDAITGEAIVAEGKQSLL
ncbi:MAG: type II secretion system protein [Candidatus Hydrogenedentes bacterium]|nr:type II secretion system protein [Candidatus Hydrogenedentota bacterium]